MQIKLIRITEIKRKNPVQMSKLNAPLELLKQLGALRSLQIRTYQVDADIHSAVYNMDRKIQKKHEDNYQKRLSITLGIHAPTEDIMFKSRFRESDGWFRVNSCGEVYTNAAYFLCNCTVFVQLCNHVIIIKKTSKCILKALITKNIEILRSSSTQMYFPEIRVYND